MSDLADPKPHQSHDDTRMPDVYWMGGSPCCGKTTIANILAQEHGWHIYHIDRHVESYLQRAQPEQHPTLTNYRQMGLQHFLSLSAETQLESVKSLSREQFEFIVADVREMPDDRPLLVEGANMLPGDVAHTASDLQHIIWLVPTETFLLRTYPRRGTWVQEVLKYHFPEERRLDVFDNWMQRDALMADWTARRARELDICVITVDGSRTVRENAVLVEGHFGLKGVG